MKRVLILLPILFWGVKPYQQPITTCYKVDSLTQFERDTISLSIMKTNLIINLNIADKLEERKQQLLQELQELKKAERSLKKKQREERRIKESLHKYENRGL